MSLDLLARVGTADGTTSPRIFVTNLKEHRKKDYLERMFNRFANYESQDVQASNETNYRDISSIKNAH